LIGWTKERGIKWDVSKTEAGDRVGCWLEIYLTDEAIEPDPEKWETEVAIRLANR
jgi:effector-binding domain-containing protein